MNGWWDKPPLATEDVSLREDLRVGVSPNRPRLALRGATLENRPGATGLLVTPAEGQAPLYE
jgi:hypothetical protein